MLKDPIVFTCEGKEYKVYGLTQKFQQAYGQWVESRCWAELQAMKPQCSEEDYRHLLSEHLAMRRHDQFELYVGTEAWKYLDTKEGYVYFMFLAFRKYQHGITEEQVREMMVAHPEEFRQLLGEILQSKKESTEV